VLAARTTPDPRAVVPSQSISASRTILGISGWSGEYGLDSPAKSKQG